MYNDTGQRRVKCVDVYHGVKLFSDRQDKVSVSTPEVTYVSEPEPQRTSYRVTETKKMSLK